MIDNTILTRSRAARAAAFLIAVVAALVWSNVAHAEQSSDAQYGAPTGGGPTGGTLPATGGPEILVALGVLALVAAGLMFYLRRRAARR